MPGKNKRKAAASSKKLSAPVRGRSPEKRQALEAIGLEKSSAEILAAAKAQGIVVSRTYVDLLKKKLKGGSSTTKRKPGRPPKASSSSAPQKRGPGRPKKSVTTHHAAGSNAEQSFRKLAGSIVIDAGAPRARSLLESVIQHARAAGER